MTFNLGFHYHIPALHKSGFDFTPGYQGRFLDALATHCEKLVCFLHEPLPDEEAMMDYQLQASNIEVISIGKHGSVPQRIFNSRSITAPLRRIREELDAVLLRGPSPLLPQMAKAAGATPIALLLVGDYLAGIDDLPQPFWRKELIRLWAKWNFTGQMKTARRSLTLVNSHLLYNQLLPQVPNLLEIRTTTLTEEDFYVRDDTCQSSPIHLLYTGRMTHAKGILDLVEAVNELVHQNIDVVLHLVGMEETGDPLIHEMENRAIELGISERVCYHGYRPIGPELFEFYKRADIYLIGSKSSEGFPRTIWEAMAHSLPVVATRVGSIPDFIEGSAILVEAGNPSLLSEGIRIILSNSQLRKNFIKRGITLARKNTLEGSVGDIFTPIIEHVRKTRSSFQA